MKRHKGERFQHLRHGSSALGWRLSLLSGLIGFRRFENFCHIAELSNTW
jgi:hypothetical protein